MVSKGVLANKESTSCVASCGHKTTQKWRSNKRCNIAHRICPVNWTKCCQIILFSSFVYSLFSFLIRYYWVMPRFSKVYRSVHTWYQLISSAKWKIVCSFLLYDKTFVCYYYISVAYMSRVSKLRYNHKTVDL